MTYSVVWAYSGDPVAGPFTDYEHAKVECDRLEKASIYPVTIRTSGVG